MNITKWSVKNYLTIFVLIAMIVMIGLMSYISLPREAAPDITIPYIIVSTVYPGVSPIDMETLVTHPLEKKLKNLANVKKISSTSGDSFSAITIEYRSGVDIDDALRKVKDKVDTAKSDLPKDCNDPEVMEINLSDFPIMIINVAGDFGPVQLKTVADRIKEEIEGVKGVLDVKISGGVEREIQIIPDPEKLKKFAVSLNQISQTLSGENLNIPGGVIDIGSNKYQIRIPSEFKTVEDIENVVVASPKGNPIYLRDLANVEDSFKDITSYSRMNNIDSVSISVQKRSGENIIRIGKDIQKRLKDLEHRLPTGTQINVVTNSADRITEMVDELENSIMLGLVLVILTLFFFMGFKNATFISLAMPFSMLIAFTVFSLFGVTLNMVVLFALILALGRLVDDAIVVVENIFRHYQMGHSRVEAALKGTSEVTSAVVTSTLTTVAAMLPLLFIPGIAGQFMKYLPICVISTILASLFVAVCINPVLSSRFMSKESRFFSSTETVAPWYVEFYSRVLDWALSRKKRVVGLTILSLILSVVLAVFLLPGVEFFPETTPAKSVINVTAPQSYNLDATNDIVVQIEKALKENRNINNIITVVGTAGGGHFSGGGTEQSNQASITVEYQDVDKRIESPFQTIEWIREKMANIPGAEIDITNEAMGPPSGAPIGISVAGKDFEKIRDYVDQIKDIMREMGGIVDITDDYIKARPEIVVRIDRDRASQLGINSMLLASTIRTSIQGSKVSTLRDGSDDYDISVRLPENQRDNVQSLEELFVTNFQGQPISILDVAQIEQGNGVGAIRHQDLDRVITIEAKPAAKFFAAERLKAIQKRLKNFPMEEGYSVKFVGENEMMQETSAYLKKAMLIAVFIIALILITEFNSYVLPFIILTTIVFSLIGILLGLVIFQRPFGIIMTGVGVISLAGVIVNNGIVLIDYINQLRKRGYNAMDAVRIGGRVRLRPVLLTAVATVLGLVPMTFGINFDFKHFFANLFQVNPFSNFFGSVILGGDSFEFWGSMGSAVTMGMVVGTLLTLIVVPVLYVIFDQLGMRFKAWLLRTWGIGAHAEEVNSLPPA